MKAVSRVLPLYWLLLLAVAQGLLPPPPFALMPRTPQQYQAGRLLKRAIGTANASTKVQLLKEAETLWPESSAIRMEIIMHSFNDMAYEDLFWEAFALAKADNAYYSMEQALNGLGLLYMNSNAADIGTNTHAAALFRGAIEAEPSFAAAYNNLAIVLQRLSLHGLSLRAAVLSLALEPLPSAYLNAGNAAFFSGLKEEATQFLK